MAWRRGRKGNPLVGAIIIAALIVFSIINGVSTSGRKADKGAWPDSGSATGSEAAYSYVLNTNTKKIHQPSCSSVMEMASHNREYTNKSAEELEREGYVKCQRCFG